MLHSLELKQGDVLLTPATSYNACKLAMKRTAERAGAQFVEFDIRLPVNSPVRTIDFIDWMLDQGWSIDWEGFISSLSKVG